MFKIQESIFKNILFAQYIYIVTVEEVLNHIIISTPQNTTTKFQIHTITQIAGEIYCIVNEVTDNVINSAKIF
jgi:hypothetical protein